MAAAMSGVKPSNPPSDFATILVLVVAARIRIFNWPSVRPLAALRREGRSESKHNNHFIVIEWRGWEG